MEKNIVLQMINVSKQYRLGQTGYRTLRDDFVNLFKRQDRQKNYFLALNNISFSLMQGESLGIIGDNGSGKSTILKILSGVTQQTCGIVKKKGAVGALIELSAGFHPELTGRENIFLYGSIIGIKQSHIKERFDEIVEFSGLSQFLDTPVKKYSSGMFARLGFSVTVHLEPDILLIDEVLSVGDFAFQKKCINKMIEYKKKGVPILFVSHNMDSVRELCDQALLLDKGAIAARGDIETVINEYYIRHSQQQKGSSRLSAACTLTNKKLLNENGMECAVFNTGEKSAVELTFRMCRNVESVCYAVFVRNSSGMVVFDTSTDLLCRTKYTYTHNQTVILCFEFEMNLLKGIYMLGCNISAHNDREEDTYIFYENNIFTFRVMDTISHQGIANLHAQCSVGIVL